MTRLSEALKRAAAANSTPFVATEQPATPGADWQFAPVETMHVPEGPAPSPLALQGSALAPDFEEAAWSDIAEEPVSPDPIFEIPEPAAPAATAAAAAAPAPRAIRVGAEDRDKLVIGKNVHPEFVEQYRHLAAVLHHAQKASGVRTVMITSALPSEGKTLTATNLALTLSESYQRRVLLIDADLRRPRVREMFALPKSEGLTDALTQPRGDRLPVRQISPNLWVLVSGGAVPDPMSLLVSPAMKQLIDDAKASFDWVVVDTPPIAILPDANLLAAMIDRTLLVVSAQSTPYPMVQRAADAVGPKRILGVVLNRAESSGPSSGYGYYDYQTRPMPPKDRRWFGWLRRAPRPHVQ